MESEKKKKFVKSVLTGMVIGAVFFAGKEFGRMDMYSRMMRHIEKATAKSCTYEMPVEDRKLSFEDAAKAAIYRTMVGLEDMARKERPY